MLVLDILIIGLLAISIFGYFVKHTYKDIYGYYLMFIKLLKRYNKHKEYLIGFLTCRGYIEIPTVCPACKIIHKCDKPSYIRPKECLRRFLFEMKYSEI